VRQRLSTALLRAEMTSLRRLAISYDSGLRGDADGYAAARARRDDAVGLAELRGVYTLRWLLPDLVKKKKKKNA